MGVWQTEIYPRSDGRSGHLGAYSDLEAGSVKPPNSWTLNCTRFKLPPPLAHGRRAPGRVLHGHVSGAASVC